MNRERIHTIVTPSGETFSGRILWTGNPRWDRTGNIVSYKWEIGGVEVWLDNRHIRPKHGTGTEWWWAADAAAVRKIKKALGSAANSIPQI